MASKRQYLVCKTLVFSVLTACSALAQPITGLTYTYDLSAPDVDPGGFPVMVRPYMDPGNSADDTLDDSNPAAITIR